MSILPPPLSKVNLLIKIPAKLEKGDSFSFLLAMEKSDDGWDLFAVVRSCRPEKLSPEKVAPANSYEELEKLCNPFFYEAQQPKQSPLPSSSSSSSLAAAPRRPLSQTNYRSKKKRNQQKKVICEVPADGLSSDMWAWRKYGQKPIKGSPYPRGYYRCSSSKGCLARKQVERSRTDPAIFIITYSGEHNHSLPSHRNSLAGCTRQKFPPSAAAGEQGSRPDGSPITPLKREESEEDDDDDEEEEEGILSVEDMEVVGEDEVLFMGIQKTAGEVSECFDGESCCFDQSFFLPPFE